MKKNIFSIILVLTINMTFALPQSEQTARQIAENFLNQRGNDHFIDYSYTIAERDVNLLYVYNLLPAGFIAVTADNDLPPVLAYSLRQALLNEQRQENMLHQMLQTDIDLRMQYYRLHPAEAEENRMEWQSLLAAVSRDEIRFQQWPPAGTTITDGWVETQWNQSGVYNQMCPLDNSGERSVVGCVATAMAMIMDFHAYAGNPVFTDADDYISGYYNGIYIDNDWQDHDFPPFPELNYYLQDVAAHYAAGLPLTADDKAALNFACGVSVEMNYSSSGSGAWTSMVADALLNKFDYDSAEYIENYGSTFYDVLIDNMQSMQPTELTIYQPDYEGGHAIICDGYNTDDYYHLNFGWGTSNNTCWYTLPSGMPSGYTILSGAVVNIEGGVIPVGVTGEVNVANVSPIDTYITLEGPGFYECWIDDASGDFAIPAVLPGQYTATALLNSRSYYQSIDITIDEYNSYIQFDLGEFEYFSGHVNAPVPAENATITLYQDGLAKHSGNTDVNGDFQIPDVLPGNYFVLASLAGNYFQAKSVEISLDDQTEDFALDEYPGEMGLSFAGSETDLWNLIPNYTVSCGIKLTQDDLLPFENDVIAGVRFKSPINSDEGELFAQVWINDVLMTETEITDFSAGEWLDVDLNSFVTVISDQEYFVGYKIFSTTGAMAYRDAGPRVAGKGAYFNNGSWIQLASNNDFNFCIEAKIITQEFGTISGSIDLNGGNGVLQDVVIKAGSFSSHPDANGNYQFDIKSGVYDLTALLQNYDPDQISNLEIFNGDLIENQNFSLNYGVNAGDVVTAESAKLLGNYPNPFNPSTAISFITRKETENTEISVYNLKGQKVKTLVNSKLPAGQHTVVWNGRDDAGKAVSSGIYFYKMKAAKLSVTKKMILTE